ncbi:hypothetical protein D3C87_1932490 [compost metagenome]
MEVYTYGAMSSKFQVKAENKLTAYATMVLHYDRSAHMLMIYSPESSKDDQWASFDGKISDRLDEVFGGSFDKYVEGHIEEIKASYKTIKRLV